MMKINKIKVFVILVIFLIGGLVLLDSSVRDLFVDKTENTESEKVVKTEEDKSVPVRDLMKKYKCFTCHQTGIDDKAPSFISISRKFRNDSKASEDLILKVEQSQMFMDHFKRGETKPSRMYLLNDQPISKKDIREMVKWILRLRVG